MRFARLAHLAHLVPPRLSRVQRGEFAELAAQLPTRRLARLEALSAERRVLFWGMLVALLARWPLPSAMAAAARRLVSSRRWGLTLTLASTRCIALELLRTAPHGGRQPPTECRPDRGDGGEREDGSLPDAS